MTTLTLQGIEKSYGTLRVLRGIDLTIESHSITAILGPSGSGKTTLLRIVAGFERADRGDVLIGTRVVDSAHEFVNPDQRSVGYVPQEGSLFPHLSVAKNVGFGLSRDGREKRVSELLSMIGMEGLGRRYPHELSGGQQQRVALARALAIEPGIVLLDEPFSSLDETLRASVRDEVIEMLRATKTTAVLVTHDQDEALSSSDRVAVIQEGRIGQHDTPRGLYELPLGQDLARFIGDANLIEGVSNGEIVTTYLGEHELSCGARRANLRGEVVVLVRPEQVALFPVSPSSQITGRIGTSKYFGHDATVTVHVRHSDDEIELTARVQGNVVPDPDVVVGIGVVGPVVAWKKGDDEALSDPRWLVSFASRSDSRSAAQ